MPAKSEEQRRAAGAELARRRRGVKRQKKGSETRAFGSASERTLIEFARK